MTVHPKDRCATNPRLQCSVCRKWMRLHGRNSDGASFQRFYGSCNYTRGDHLAGDRADVCDECCHKECKRLAGCDCQAPEVENGAALVSEACPIHNRLTLADIETQEYLTLVEEPPK